MTDRRQIADVLASVRDVLGSDLVGAYLHGSAVLGGLRPRSDLDLLAVSRRRMADEEREYLVARLLAVSGRHSATAPPRPVELTIVVSVEIRPWRYPPRLEFQYGEWWRDRFENGDLEPWSSPSPDLAVVLTVTRRQGVVLSGPEPTQLFDVIPQADLADAMKAGVRDLVGDLDSDTTNVVLTLARIWNSLISGEIRSKDAAAECVVRQLDDRLRAVLVRARAIYVGAEQDRWDDLRDRLGPFAEAIVSEIGRARPVG